VKRYSFPLAQVLRVRRLEEDQAAARLAGARSEATAAAEHADRRRAALAALAPPVAAPATRFLAWSDQVGLTGDALTAAGRRRDALFVELDARRSEWSAAAMRVSALERLDDRRRETHHRQVLRVEAGQVDDLVVSRRRSRA
jgi:flagellar FliJ protein